MDEEKEWDLFYENDKTWAWWLAKNGSKFDKELPFLHWEFNFNKENSFKDIVKSVTDINLRKKWDKEIKQITKGSKIWKDANIIYTKYQTYNLLGQIDSVDKQYNFLVESEEGNPIFVSYSSSLPEGIVPKVHNVRRIHIYFSISVFELLEDGSTCLQTFSQFDAGPRLRKKHWDDKVRNNLLFPNIVLFP